MTGDELEKSGPHPKRYLIFEFPAYYPSGGLGDIRGAANDWAEVIQVVQSIKWREYIQLLDTLNWTMAGSDYDIPSSQDQLEWVPLFKGDGGEW